MIDRRAFRPRRSVLYMPSSNERALEKAKSIPCDGLILDLEDAVAPDAKAAAREAACAAAQSGEYGRRELTIRVNGADTEWHADDLAAACAAGPDAIVVPKVNSADAVRAAGRGDGRQRRPRAHQALGDGRDAVRDVARRTTSPSASDRLTVLVMGTNDLAKELYAEHVPGRQPLLTGLSLALLAARATGKAIIDGVYNDVKNTDGFLAECQQGREMGFDGKTLIHPGQVEGANEAFAPSEQAVEDARGILAGLGGRQGIRRGHLQRPDDREPPRRVRPADPGHRRGDRGTPNLSATGPWQTRFQTSGSASSCAARVLAGDLQNGHSGSRPRGRECSPDFDGWTLVLAWESLCTCLRRRRWWAGRSSLLWLRLRCATSARARRRRW